MSAITDHIRAILDDQWRSTKEIADAIPEWEGMNEYGKCARVHRILASELRYGLVEHKVVLGGPGGRTALWRRPS